MVPFRLYVEPLEAFGYKSVNPNAMLGSRPLPAASLKAQSWLRCPVPPICPEISSVSLLGVILRLSGCMLSSWRLLATKA